MADLSYADRERLMYAAGHLRSSEDYPENAHAGDSAELAYEVFEEVIDRHVEAERTRIQVAIDSCAHGHWGDSAERALLKDINASIVRKTR